MRLVDKVVVVTGASRGFGRATALASAKEGADVVVNYYRSRELALRGVSERQSLLPLPKTEPT